MDEKGGLVKQGGIVKTLAANLAVGQAQRKKENPYLAHRHSSSDSKVVGAADHDPSGILSTIPGLQVHTYVHDPPNKLQQLLSIFIYDI